MDFANFALRAGEYFGVARASSDTEHKLVSLDPEEDHANTPFVVVALPG